MSKEERIKRLTTLINADNEMWDVLWAEENALKAQRERIWSRKYANECELKRLLGLKS